MRIRDAVASRQHQRALDSIGLTLRSRDAGCTRGLPLFLLRSVEYVQNEAALLRARRVSVLRFQFSLDAMDDKQCLERFRCTKPHIECIVSFLDWPSTMNSTKRRRYSTNAVEAFCILTRLLSTPSRWCDLESEFGRHSASLSEIFYECLEYFYERFSALLRDFRADFLSQRASRYANAVLQAGAPLDKCVGFIDGTNIYIAKPRGLAHRATYSGHKRRNCLKFQALSLPDGLILHMFGPVEGRRHDMTLFRRSEVENRLRASLLIAGVQYYVYGDPAYVLLPYLQTGFRGAVLTPEQQEFNEKIPMVRIAVEWVFKDIKKYFTAVDSPRKLSITTTPAGLL